MRALFHNTHTHTNFIMSGADDDWLASDDDGPGSSANALMENRDRIKMESQMHNVCGHF